MTKFHVKHLLVISLAVWLCGVGLPTYAQKTYRCTSPGGGVTFTDTPCADAPGNEIVVKPSAGAAPKLSLSGNPRLEEALARLSPKCRRAFEAFQAKAADKEGVKELRTPGNPITAAVLACEPEFAAASQPSAKELEKMQAEDRKRREQDRIASECATKRSVIDERRPRFSTLSPADQAALRAVEQDVARSCR